MNSLANNHLYFHNTTFSCLEMAGQIWLTAAEISQALGYANDKAIHRLYRKHIDEFTVNMTGVVKVNTPGGVQDSRVFSLRGAHLMGMFSRTMVAKEFRHWVLDIIDREVVNGTASPIFTGSVLLDFDAGVMTRAKVAQPDERLISVKTVMELMQMNGFVMTTKEELKEKAIEAIEKLH